MSFIPQFSDYNKITDDLFYFGINAVLRMNVGLNSRVGNNRENFHREVAYVDNYGDMNCNIKRNFDCYLSIENIKMATNGYREFIRIGLVDLVLVREKFSEALRWFRDKKFTGLFVQDINGVLIVGKNVSPIEITGLPMNKYIILEPTVFEYTDNRSEPGVRLYLSNMDNFTIMPFSRFITLVNIFLEFNIIMSAQMMLAYFGRPEYGHNLYNMNSGESASEIEPSPNDAFNRKHRNNTRKSKPPTSFLP